MAMHSTGLRCKGDYRTGWYKTQETSEQNQEIGRKQSLEIQGSVNPTVAYTGNQDQDSFERLRSVSAPCHSSLSQCLSLDNKVPDTLSPLQLYQFFGPYCSHPKVGLAWFKLQRAYIREYPCRWGCSLFENPKSLKQIAISQALT